MFSSEHFNTIAALDLEPIKVKLMHVESGEGWSLEKADAVEFEYRRFLYLMKMFPQEQTAPLMDVDIFWHYHILDTMKYAIDCEAVFGYFLHHFPYIGLRGEDDEAAHERVGQRMKELYETTFGEQYGIGARAGTPAQAFSGRVSEQTAFSGRISAQTAFSGRVAEQTAFSGRISAATAFSGAVAEPTIAAKVAFSGRISADNVTAFSGRVADKTAFSGHIQAAAPVQDQFYAARPRIAAE